MSETSESDSDLQIEIYEEIEDSHGSRVEEKREALQPQIETVTSNNWQQHFPDKELTPDTKRELDEGLLYLKVAIDPQSGAKAGSVEVRHQHDNALSVEVSEDYQRRGVASSLIRQAQTEHDQLHLLNFAGAAGENLYLKMGFKQEGAQDHFVWKKDQ
jgi:GNAT superfamily N-acetyltransferase